MNHGLLIRGDITEDGSWVPHLASFRQIEVDQPPAVRVLALLAIDISTANPSDKIVNLANFAKYGAPPCPFYCIIWYYMISSHDIYYNAIRISYY